MKCSDRLEGVKTPVPQDHGPLFGVTPLSHHTTTPLVVALCATRYASPPAPLAAAQIPLSPPVNLLSGSPSGNMIWSAAAFNVPDPTGASHATVLPLSLHLADGQLHGLDVV